MMLQDIKTTSYITVDMKTKKDLFGFWLQNGHFLNLYGFDEIISLRVVAGNSLVKGCG